ncbi:MULTISPECIES: lipid II:glycine glycyltransferase FemX [Streptomyces]|uniref:Lipid II:glycine glycyltransferase n=1 Tax=Streptomyces rimosus subsp. rimosus TaxID=132474 RepID=A0ABY3ZEZ3_STRRM|nr:peptidoglycan bridge formation protein FemAB [Kitasatospora aureofaciens]KUJ35527.1 peptidoglycan bridge formation protein FemAB [Streptomyces rimosus subsp. rimosus]MYT43694.1 peptidoglycan bridge formation glycyltransferase FemA/FemB family protein [Streptomyces sp. SID5471]QEV80280.1 peptidoglycan bridge formation glycyltransferase FemA/FemB family protein [Streptomyces rimosus]QTL91148.1 aminoacyltransferase [Streptomyces rimosus subsp. rimosus]
MAFRVRTITAGDHAAFNASQPAVSFLQTPAWASVKSEWGSESLGWFDDRDQLVGAGLVLYRRLPGVKTSLAYLPEGPVIDWASDDLAGRLGPLVEHLKRSGAFAIRIGTTVAARTWSAATVKAAIADPGITRLSDVPPDTVNDVAAQARVQLRHLGWRPPKEDEGFSAGQPRWVFQVPLAGKDENQLLKGMNQLWRRNIKKAGKAGVVVTQGGIGDLPDFYRVYLETAKRDHFIPRPFSYFPAVFEALLAEDKDRIRLYLAHHEGDLVAATIWIRVGQHAWYSYGASSTAKREVRGSNAVQWQMVTDALAAGCTVYNLRGITDTVDENDPHLGLIQFKVGTGGEAVEYLGEWDLPLNRLLYKAFDVYMSRRS